MVRPPQPRTLALRLLKLFTSVPLTDDVYLINEGLLFAYDEGFRKQGEIIAIACVGDWRAEVLHEMGGMGIVCKRSACLLTWAVGESLQFTMT